MDIYMWTGVVKLLLLAFCFPGIVSVLFVRLPKNQKVTKSEILASVLFIIILTSIIGTYKIINNEPKEVIECIVVDSRKEKSETVTFGSSEVIVLTLEDNSKNRYEHKVGLSDKRKYKVGDRIYLYKSVEETMWNIATEKKIKKFKRIEE